MICFFVNVYKYTYNGKKICIYSVKSEIPTLPKNYRKILKSQAHPKRSINAFYVPPAKRQKLSSSSASTSSSSSISTKGRMGRMRSTRSGKIESGNIIKQHQDTNNNILSPQTINITKNRNRNRNRNRKNELTLSPPPFSNITARKSSSVTLLDGTK